MLERCVVIRYLYVIVRFSYSFCIYICFSALKEWTKEIPEEGPLPPPRYGYVVRNIKQLKNTNHRYQACSTHSGYVDVHIWWSE